MRQTPTQILQTTFGYPAFRGLQEDIVTQVVAGGDALVLMPTGGGKSLCYQIPAIARQQAGQGVTVVISPLIALMHDQVGALLEAGVAAAFLNSSLDFQAALAVEQQMHRGDLTLLYAAPERITTPRFMAQLDSLYERGQLALFAIDEAHCVSQWGHDFRPEYRALSVLHERYPTVPRMALTATADKLTQEDMIERLQLQDAKRFVSSFDRPNIHYTITEKTAPLAQLLRFIEADHADESGIVYCQSRKRVEEIAVALCEEGYDALPYHAGLNAAVRMQHQDRFLRGEGVIMVATIAFGMGIDKPDVRFVAHVDMPKNIESYYQETGRAGRDGLAAYAWMCYGLQDVVNQRRMIDESPAQEDFKQGLRGKLDALLQLAESHTCRRTSLLQYFGEASRARCGNCDNCQHPPAVWDASDAAQKLLSTIYRIQQKSGIHFGAGHLIDVVRGKTSDKVSQYGHHGLSTFGLGKDYSELQLRSVLRQLIAADCIRVNANNFNTLELSSHARPVLKGEQRVTLRAAKPKESRTGRASNLVQGVQRSNKPAVLLQFDAQATQRYDALTAWRAEVAKAHDLPAYVIFHNATLAAIAQAQPRTLADLNGISGLGAKKLEAYGAEILRVVHSKATRGV